METVKKSIRKRILRSVLIFFISILTLVLILNTPIIILNHQANETNYSNWMSETLSNEQRVVDVAMLGAHDSFSNEINLFSTLDPYETNGIMKGFTGKLIKGFIVKQSITQISSAEELLNSGVRYLDIRLTYEDEIWYTKHNYLSGDFEPIAEQIIEFLQSNVGEFLILDFQHISGLEYSSLDDYNIFLNMLETYGLLDYAQQVDDLSNLTYGNVTGNGSISKVIIISKFDDSAMDVFQYDSTVRSNWSDSDDFEYILGYIQTEADAIEELGITDNLRVMQAVATMQMNGPGILKAITSWSLIVRANDFNNYLLDYDSFEDLLDYLPIVMVDYSDTNKKDFNKNIMGIIIDFNQN